METCEADLGLSDKALNIVETGHCESIEERPALNWLVLLCALALPLILSDKGLLADDNG